MKTWETLREKQTTSIQAINDRISVVTREWESGQQTESTKDLFIDGHCYTPAVSDAWIAGALPTVISLCLSQVNQRHIGMGEWVKSLGYGANI